MKIKPGNILVYTPYNPPLMMVYLGKTGEGATPHGCKLLSSGREGEIIFVNLSSITRFVHPVYACGYSLLLGGHDYDFNQPVEMYDNLALEFV